MESSTLMLDQLWSATSTFSITWSEGIESNQAYRVPHSVRYRLYDVSRGNLINTRLTVAQTTLAHKRRHVATMGRGDSEPLRAGWFLGPF